MCCNKLRPSYMYKRRALYVFFGPVVALPPSGLRLYIILSAYLLMV